MVYIDWKRILTITPETFSDDEKDELVENVVWYTPPPEINREQLTALLKVLQEILKYKNEQVESLMTALDELASKQGEEVARGRQELMDELDEVREQLEYMKRLERDTGVSDDGLRSELVKLEMQNEELVLELQEREKDLVAEKTEAERLVNQVARLEREKLQLSRELSAYQEETSDRRGRSTTDSPDGSTEKVEELVEVVRQKNKHIMQLLDDIETVEQENNALRVKLTTARNEISEANNTISESTEQTTSLKIALDDSRLNFKDLEDKNKALSSQVEELIEKKAINDRELDEFALKLNERVEEWKQLLDSKDSEIISLKEELETYETKPWNEGSSEPRAKLQIIQLEKDITELQAIIQNLKIENDTKLQTIEGLKKSMSENEGVKKAHAIIENLEENINCLRDELKMVEEETLKKEEEISELVIQLRGYERGEFGLTEAVEKIKLSERRLQEKETKLESLVEACNKLSLDRDNLEEENIYLREKMGLSPTRIVIDSTAVEKRCENNAQIIKNLRQEMEILKNNVINLKLKNRELLSQNPSIQAIPEDAEMTINHEERYVRMVEENDALRKGLHEILETVQNETMGDVKIKSLEHLLEALDARHVSGWYHPAMRLQAQLQTIRGECQELRLQLKELKVENLVNRQDSEAAKAVIITLEEKIRQMHGSGGDQVAEENVKSVETELGLERKCVEFEVAVKQAKLSLDEAEATWEKEKRKLIKERDEFAARVPEQGTTESEHTPYLSKTITFLKIREEILENNLDDLRTGFLTKENESLSKIINLENEKAQLMIQIRAMENKFSFFEPAEKLAQLEKELSLLNLKYNQALKSITPLEVQEKTPDVALTDDPEKISLLQEVRNLKEKLYDAEAQLNCYGDNVATPDTFHNELSILSSKLADCETQIIKEKSKTTVLEKCLENVNSYKKEQIEKITDLTQQVQELTNINWKLQESLCDVEYRIKTETSHTDKLLEINFKIESVVQEKRNVEELLELSRKQCRSLHVFKESKKIEYDIWQDYFNSSTSNSNEKIARELIAEKTKCLELNQRNEEAQSAISRLLSENLSKESRLLSVASETLQVKETFIQQFKMVYKMLYDVHNACSNAFHFPSIHRAHRIINTLEEHRKKLAEKLLLNENLGKNLELKNDEIQVQLEALDDLKSAFQSDPRKLVGWHNRTTELRLRETRLKRQNQFLTEQVCKLDSLVKRYTDEISCMEEKMIERERDWETKQKQWEFSQLSLCGLFDKKWETPCGNSEENSVVSQLESKITHLQLENRKLQQEMEQRESVFREKLAERVYRSKTSPEKKTLTVELDGESEVKALTVTVSSLQAIVKQKEETIFRYQELLKKGREDHSNAIRRLQNELKNVHNALAQESKAHSRLKHGIYQPAAADIEKYVIMVQELEERIAELQSNTGRLNNQLKSSQRDLERLSKVVTEKDSLLNEERERMESEIERYRGEVQNYQLEVEQLRELAQGGQTKMLIETVADLQKKLSMYGERGSVRPISAKRIDNDDQLDVLLEKVKRQLKASQEECSRLRDQIQTLRAQKRRPSVNKSLDNKENLVDKIRKLEETLQLSKQHEQELEELGLKRIKSVEEVTRWEERKRHQKIVEKLQAKAKQKEVDATVANNKLETIRGLLTKLERDKAILEAQVKHLTDAAKESSRMEQLATEKANIASHVAALEEELAALRMHEGGKAIATLYEKLNDQEKKLAIFELNNQAPNALADEINHLGGKIVASETQLIQLESANNDLKQKLNKVRDDNRNLRDSNRQLQIEIKSLKTSSRLSPTKNQARSSYELQRELMRLKDDFKTSQDRQRIVVGRNTELEEEVHRLRMQISLWEEKDLADTLARTNQQQMVTELHQELIQVKAKLTHKMHLLDRVKVLLKKAAAKEQALNDRVSALQSMIPGSR